MTFKMYFLVWYLQETFQSWWLRKICACCFLRHTCYFIHWNSHHLHDIRSHHRLICRCSHMIRCYGCSLNFGLLSQTNGLSWLIGLYKSMSKFQRSIAKNSLVATVRSNWPNILFSHKFSTLSIFWSFKYLSGFIFFTDTCFFFYKHMIFGRQAQLCLGIF